MPEKIAEQPCAHCGCTHSTAYDLGRSDERRQMQGEIDAGLQIAGSFFEALKPLNLEAIDVANPGRHVADLVTERIALKRALGTGMALCVGEGNNQGGRVEVRFRSVKEAQTLYQILVEIVDSKRTDSQEALS